MEGVEGVDGVVGVEEVCVTMGGGIRSTLREDWSVDPPTDRAGLSASVSGPGPGPGSGVGSVPVGVRVSMGRGWLGRVGGVWVVFDGAVW